MLTICKALLDGILFLGYKKEDFKSEYLDALKENCLSNYLPISGGAWQNYSPRNYTSNERKKISSKRTKFYVAEYHPRIKIYDSPKFHTEKSYYEENDINDWWSFYRWGTERRMKFGY